MSITERRPVKDPITLALIPALNYTIDANESEYLIEEEEAFCLNTIDRNASSLID